MDTYKRSRLLTAIKKFNEADYFECHEILEDIWFDVRGNSRDFYQGLLHIAVGFYHLTKINTKNALPASGVASHNFKGTIIQLDKAINKLNKYDEVYSGIKLHELLKQLKSISVRLKKKEVPKRLPKIIIQ